MNTLSILDSFEIARCQVWLVKRPASNVIGSGGYSVQGNSDHAARSLGKKVGTSQLNYSTYEKAAAAYVIEVDRVKNLYVDYILYEAD